VGTGCPRGSVGPTFYRVSYREIYAYYTRLIEVFSWNPTICKALTVRERKYWINYMDYKGRMTQYNKLMTPVRP
jgi:hypothetical protein